MSAKKLPLTVETITSLILKHNESKALRRSNGCTYRPLVTDNSCKLKSTPNNLKK
jgi:hypothetical protein